MKKILSVVTCGVLAACSCSENQWENVGVVTYDEPIIYDEDIVVEPAPVEITPAKVIVEQEPVYAPAPQPAYNCPCAVSVPCYQPCPCMQPVMVPAPQPKITTTKKVITTTTTIEEPCGKPVCEPVVTTHEEVLPVETNYNTNVNYNQGYAPNYTQPAPVQEDYIEVTVEKDPYRSEVVDMRATAGKTAKTAVKYSPEAYNVVATRATNRMLQDTAALYSNGRTKTVFLKDTKVLSSDLPYGSQRLKSTTKDVLASSKAYDVVNNVNDADYVIDSSADWYVTDSATPALQYKLSLFDKSGRRVNEWVEIIRQVQE